MADLRIRTLNTACMRSTARAKNKKKCYTSCSFIDGGNTEGTESCEITDEKELFECHFQKSFDHQKWYTVSHDGCYVRTRFNQFG